MDDEQERVSTEERQAKYPYASHPGLLLLSDEKLRALDPNVFRARTFKCSPVCPEDHPAEWMRYRFAEQLDSGDSQPALVISTNPLVVAAYSYELDTVALLRFPPSFVAQYGLTVGSRLLTVNFYNRWIDRDGNLFYPADLVLGARRGKHWTTVAPMIADFLSDEAARIETHKHRIDEKEWARTSALAKLRIDAFGLHTARSGKPTEAWFPFELEPGKPVGIGLRPLRRRRNAARRLIAAVLVSILVLVAALVMHWVH